MASVKRLLGHWCPRMLVMMLDWVIPCNEVELKGQLLNLRGVGWDQLWSTGYPATFNTNLVLRFVFDVNDQDSVQVQLGFVNRDTGAAFANPLAAQVSPPPRPGDWQPGDSILASHLVLGLAGLPVPEPGRYGIQVTVGDQLLTTVPFWARLGMPPASAIQ